MIQELRIHGHLGEVEYFTHIVGEDVSKTIFYEDTLSHVRFFARGSEFVIRGNEVSYRGHGGSFCQYMFGVDKPSEDTTRREVANRLIMFGAYIGDSGHVVFTDIIEGSETFYKLFFLGHAVCNYYFLITSDQKGSHQSRQKEILRAVGKFLKRTVLDEDEDCARMIAGLRASIREERSNIFIFKIINRHNREFYSFFSDLYRRDRTMGSEQELLLEEIARKYNIDEYQQERMKIDVMYRHPANKPIVDEYRDILINADQEEVFRAAEAARLRRLRTLGIRNNIPGILFDTLDAQFLKGRILFDEKEPEYLKEARGILETIFFKDPKLKKHIISEDIVRLLGAKQMAYEKSDMGFEQIVLDAGKVCDEVVRETNDFSIFEELSGILTYFDRFDNVSSVLNNIAFSEKVDISEDMLRSLLGNKKEFDQLQGDLFNRIFASHFLTNKYISPFGKKRVDAVFRGLSRITVGDASVHDLVNELKKISDEEKTYKLVLKKTKERIKDIFPRLGSKRGRETVRREIEGNLSKRGQEVEIPEAVFEKVIFDLRKESFYLTNILPDVLRLRDVKTREDFLENSGLDRFYIETVEREFLREQGIPQAHLEEILNSSSSAA